MGLYLVTLLAIVALAVLLLGAVALAAAARRGAHQTGLSRSLVRVVDHLNGDAAPPWFVVDVFAAAPSTQRVVESPAEQDAVPEPAPEQRAA